MQKIADNNTTNVQEILSVLQYQDDSSNIDMIKQLRCNETFLINTSVAHATKNEMQFERNDTHNVPQHFDLKKELTRYDKARKEYIHRIKVVKKIV